MRKLNSVILHESTFINGSTIGPRLGTGGTNTMSSEAVCTHDDHFVYVAIPKGKLIIPMSNVKGMVAADESK